MIHVEELAWRKADRTVLREVSFDITRGEACAITGPDGSRTALLRILATLIRPSSGHASIDGIDVVSHAFRVRRDVFLAGPVLPLGDVTVAEYLRLLRDTRTGRRDPAAVANCLERSELSADVALEILSPAQRRRLALIAAVVLAPKVVLLEADDDEDHEFRSATVGELRKRDVTVLAGTIRTSPLWERTIALEGAALREAVVA
jgi:ABC-2 type transport system ATP-binding protein